MGSKIKKKGSYLNLYSNSLSNDRIHPPGMEKETKTQKNYRS